MSRRLLIATIAPLLGAALIAPAAASADPGTPTPNGTATGTPNGSATAAITTPPAAPPATDSPTVCKNLAATLKGGWPAFQTTLQQAKTKLGQRDLNGTQASLKQGG